MAISHLLEDFSLSNASNEPLQLMSEDSLEDLRLATFEQGYKAGWDDAVKAQADDQTRITGELGRNLEDLSFTYQEALGQMIAGVEPVFRAMVETVLPEAMTQTLGLHIVETCCELARDQVAEPISVLVPIGAGQSVKSILADNLHMQVDVLESSEMGPGQADVRIGNRECEIDCELLLSALRSSVEAFVSDSTKALKHG